MFSLMERAGKSVFEALKINWPTAKRILVVVGKGNNGGDGFICASLALKSGLAVDLYAIDSQQLSVGDAQKAREQYSAIGGSIRDFSTIASGDYDVIIDGLLGTGLQGNVSEPYAQCIQYLNQLNVPILSISIPSGVHADTGEVLGVAINAEVTLTFVGVKQGLVTGMGKQQAGRLLFDDLQVGNYFSEIESATATKRCFDDFAPLLPRSINSHKGSHGRLLCIGGNKSMAGAIRLSAEAALRSGAGLVKVYCHHDSRLQVSHGRSELMVSSDNLSQMLAWADCIVLGPGLGQDAGSRATFNEVLSYLVHEDVPTLIDADGLNLLTQHLRQLKLSQLVITPHPAEAARLLAVDTTTIESNRYHAVQQLAEKFDGTVVLKGAGSIVQTQNDTFVCDNGNPGMATAGMGDVLSGILGGLMSQGMTSSDAAVYGTCLHGAAGDLAAKNGGQRGMLASDLFPFIRSLINK